MRCSKALWLIAAAGGFAQAANAADFGAVPYAPASGPAPIVELGSGWYLRGDLGIGEANQAQFTKDLKVPDTRTSWSGDIGFGYKLNNYLRTDVTLNYFKPQHLDTSSGNKIVCPYTLQGLSSQDGATKFGYLYSQQVGTCVGKGKADIGQANVLANVYADLGTYFGITPYIGAGAGVARVQSSGTSDYYKTTDGSVYRTDLTTTQSGFPLVWVDPFGRAFNPQPKTPNGSKLAFGPQNYSHAFKKTTYGLAWAVMGGFAYNVTDQAAIDVGYQFVNNGTYTSTPGPKGAVVKRDLSTQQVKVGFRYQID